MPRCTHCDKRVAVKCDTATYARFCNRRHDYASLEPTDAEINQAREEGNRADERKPPYCPLRQNALHHAWLKGWMIAHPDDPFTVARRRGYE